MGVLSNTIEMVEVNQPLNSACASIRLLVNSPDYAKQPWKYFQNIIEILNQHGIIPDTLTPIERDQLIRSFKVENVVDNIGTASAITTYVLSMLMIRQGQQLTGFTYNTVTGVGMLFSFGCALSFTSSSYDLLHAYRHSHFRLKLIECHQAQMILMLRLWLSELDETNISAAAIIDLLKQIADKQIEDLRKELKTLQLLKRSSLIQNNYEERGRIMEEIEDLDTQLTYTIHNKKKISKIDLKKQSKEKLLKKARLHQHTIVDILQRPLYHADIDYDHPQNTSVAQRYATLSSTSLYAKRYLNIKNLAAHYLFTQDPAPTLEGSKIKNDRDLARAFLTDRNIKRYNINSDIDENSEIFRGIFEIYHEKLTKLDKYRQYPKIDLKPDRHGKKISKPVFYLNSLKLEYIQILHELEVTDKQIHNHEDEIQAMHDEMNRSARPSAIKGDPKEVQQQTESAASTPTTMVLDDNSLLKQYALKAFDTGTAFMWKAEWNELKGFFLMIKRGISQGITQLMTPDEEKYAYKTQRLFYSDYHPRLWSYHIKKRIATLGPILKAIATVFFVIANIPYFIYYALKHFAHLLDGLQRVVDGIHKAVRDIDQALGWKKDDSLLYLITYPFIFWPLKVTWALTTFIFETLGGIAYWVLTAIRSAFMKTDFNIAQTSRAINPDWLANIVERLYIDARKNKLTHGYSYNMTVVFLYIVVLLGGVYNTFATLFAKINPFYPIGHDNIRSSRMQLVVAWGLFANWCIEVWRSFVTDPILSTFNQSIDEMHKVDAQQKSSLWYLYIVAKFFVLMIVNVLILGAYRFVKGLAKTAPLITAGVVVCSTVMPGISLPFFAFVFAPTIQMNLAVASMCGDITNGSHDLYNLANSLQKRYRLRVIEHAALDKLDDKTDLAEYKKWLTVFERIEDGRDIWAHHREKLSAHLNDYSSYTGYHVNNILQRYESWVANDTFDHSIARDMLASQLAYFFVNTSDQDIEGRTGAHMLSDYKALYNSFLVDKSIEAIAVQIVSSLPDYGKLTPEQRIDYVAGMSVLAGYDLSRALMKQIRDPYMKFYGKLRTSDEKAPKYALHLRHHDPLTGEIRTYKGVRDQHNPQLLYFTDKISARKLSFFEKIKHYCWIALADVQVINGYAFSGMTEFDRKDYYATWLNPINNVNLEKGLADVATTVDTAPQTTCLFSRGTYQYEKSAILAGTPHRCSPPKSPVTPTQQSLISF